MRVGEVEDRSFLVALSASKNDATRARAPHVNIIQGLAPSSLLYLSIAVAIRYSALASAVALEYPR
jgi:hypothetical protein